MNTTPQLHGYELDQRLLEHPLAEIWRGRSFTGMEIVALVLSERGAADAQVRDRLSRASRVAALKPRQLQTPLWAANLTADRPYAVTQLVPGQSGAERLLDPLDGLLGNDDESLGAVRSQLAQYGALPIPTAEEPGGAQAESGRGRAESGGAQEVLGGLQEVFGAWVAQAAPPGAAKPRGAAMRRGAAVEGNRRPQGWRLRGVAVAAVLAVFCVLYSVGTKIGSEAKEQRPVVPAPGALVSPAPLLSPGLLPGKPK